jgi:hypothetical protein
VDGKHECRTVCLTEEIALDFGSGETLVGIEILDARRIIGKGKLPRIVLDNIAAVAAAEPPSHERKTLVKATSRLRKAKKKAA